MARRVIPESTKLKAVQLLNNGTPITKVAEQVGVYHGTVRRWANRVGEAQSKTKTKKSVVEEGPGLHERVVSFMLDLGATTRQALEAADDVCAACR